LKAHLQLQDCVGGGSSVAFQYSILMRRMTIGIMKSMQMQCFISQKNLNKENITLQQ
jgi:hypothetical protein